jgi:hypothetical protein
MDPFFAFIENSALAEWIRGESILAFPTIVTLHVFGMGFLAGGSVVINLRVLGFAAQMPLQAMARFFPVLWLAFAVNAASGTLLLIAYPTKALTNPLFYVKLCLIALAIGLVQRIGAQLRARDIPESHTRRLALVSLAAWVALIGAGRLLAYTHQWELLGVRAM